MVPSSSLDLTYSLRKKYPFPRVSKNHPKIYTKPPNGGYGNKQRDLALRKRNQDIGRKAVLSNVNMVKTARTPTLMGQSSVLFMAI